MSTLKDRLAAARPAERYVEVCLRGDLRAEHDKAEADLRRLRTRDGTPATRSAGDAAEEHALAERIVALEEQMAGEMLGLTVRAMPTREWSALILRHPPRAGVKADEALNVNFQALMEEAVPACVVDPELDADDWARLGDVLSNSDWETLSGAVFDVNRGGTEVPKSLLASLTIRGGSTGSRSPELTV